MLMFAPLAGVAAVPLLYVSWRTYRRAVVSVWDRSVSSSVGV
jgi:hypothetical protein